jgi:hypothetical protein
LHALPGHCMHCQVIACTARSLHALPGHCMHCQVISCNARSLHALPGHCIHCQVISCTARSVHAMPGHCRNCQVIACTISFIVGLTSAEVKKLERFEFAQNIFFVYNGHQLNVLCSVAMSVFYLTQTIPMWKLLCLCPRTLTGWLVCPRQMSMQN